MIEFRNYKGLSALLLLFVGLPLFAWNMAGAKTYKNAKETRKLKNKIERLHAGNMDSADTVPFTVNDDIVSNGLLLEKLAPRLEEYGIQMVEYQPYMGESNGNLLVQSAEISLSGNYIPIVKIIDLLENHIEECRVKSVTFEKSIQPKDRRVILKAIILIQQLISVQP
ncbi:MAG: hypothetical protein LIO77_07890 [Rikenellaceae bacterium]|nr:hypothetical protein [Rikenellaceae bacterium]